MREREQACLHEVVEAVHLVEELHQCPLNLTIGRRALREPLSADGIDLVHEDDAGRVLPRISKHLCGYTHKERENARKKTREKREGMRRQ